MKKVSPGFTTSGFSTRGSRRGYHHCCKLYVDGEPPAALSEMCLACPCCDACCNWAADALGCPTIDVTEVCGGDCMVHVPVQALPVERSWAPQQLHPGHCGLHQHRHRSSAPLETSRVDILKCFASTWLKANRIALHTRLRNTMLLEHDHRHACLLQVAMAEVAMAEVATACSVRRATSGQHYPEMSEDQTLSFPERTHWPAECAEAYSGAVGL